MIPLGRFRAPQKAVEIVSKSSGPSCEALTLQKTGIANKANINLRCLISDLLTCIAQGLLRLRHTFFTYMKQLKPSLFMLAANACEFNVYGSEAKN